MLKDRFFYPLAALFAAAMVLVALSFGEKIELSDRDIWENGFTLSGEDLSRLTAQPGTQAIFVKAAGGEPAYARLTSTVARATIHPKPGVFAPIGADYERAFATRRLRLTITARSSTVQGLRHFDMGYFTNGSGDSDWIRKPLSDQWNDYAMEFRPGALKGNIGLDYFAMWPGETAELLSMDVRAMHIAVIAPPP